MRYYEYKSSDGNCILDIEIFNFGKEMLSKREIACIEVPIEEGRYFNNKYISSKIEFEGDIEKINTLKNLLKEELVFKGYDLNNLVEPIIHN